MPWPIICYKNRDTPTSFCLSPHSILSLLHGLSHHRVLTGLCAVLSLLSATPTAHSEPLLAYTQNMPFQEKTPFLGRVKEGRQKYIILKTPIRCINYIVLRRKPEISPGTKWVTEKERCRKATNNGKSYLSHLQCQQSGPNPPHSKYCIVRHCPCPAGLEVYLEHVFSYKASNRGEIDTHRTFSTSLLSTWQSWPVKTDSDLGVLQKGDWLKCCS